MERAEPERAGDVVSEVDDVVDERLLALLDQLGQEGCEPVVGRADLAADDQGEKDDGDYSGGRHAVDEPDSGDDRDVPRQSPYFFFSLAV